MASKRKPPATTGGKSKKKVPDKPKIEYMKNVDIVFFQLEIKSIEDKIDKLENDSYSEQNRQLKEEIEYLIENREDDLAILDRSLTERTHEYNALELELETLRETMEQKISDCATESADQKNDFDKKYEEITSDTKILNSKLFLLNAYRDQKEELHKSYNDMNNLYNEREEIHKQKLAEVDQKLEIFKYKTKAEIDKRLLNQSNEFTKRNEQEISSYIQRLMRENVALENEMSQIFATNKYLEKRKVNERKLTKEANQTKEKFSQENQLLINESNKLLTEIMNLTKFYENLEKKLKCFDATKNSVKDLEKQRDEQLRDIERNEQLKCQLKQFIFALQTENSSQATILTGLQNIDEKYKETFHKFSMHLQMVHLMMSSSDDDTVENAFDEKFKIHTLKNFTKTLKSILLDSMTKPIIASQDTIMTIESPYGISAVEPLSVSESVKDSTSLLSPQLPLSSMDKDPFEDISSYDPHEISTSGESFEVTAKSILTTNLIDIETTSEEFLFESTEDEDLGVIDDDANAEIKYASDSD